MESKLLPGELPANDRVPRRILVIEDNSADIRLIREALSEHGVQHELTVLQDGEKALRHLEDIGAGPKPELIILDINMPRADGLSVLVRYRMNVALVDVPIIVLTSSAAPSDRHRATTIGVSEFIQKPLDFDEFLALGKTFKDHLEKPYLYSGPT